MSNIKNKVKEVISYDKYEVPIFIFKSMKREVTEVVSKFLLIKKEDIEMNVKVLKNNKYYVEFRIFSDHIVLN